MKVIKISLVGLFIVALGVVGIQTLGVTFLNKQIQAQLDQTGLASFVRFHDVSIDPFTLSLSFHQVSFGNPTYPWLIFDSITLNKGLFNNQVLDVTFQLNQTAIKKLSNDTQHLMKMAGLTELAGNGRFTSLQQDQHVTSNMALDIKGLGQFSLANQMKTQLNAALIQEIRTDMLASMAFGQPEAIFLIYGDDITFYDIKLSFQDAGLIQHLWPTYGNENNIKKIMFERLKSDTHTWGLAEATSQRNVEIAKTLTDYLTSTDRSNTQHLEISIHPDSPLSLGELYLLSKDKQLADKTNMHVAIKP
ncbi:hypothetical protein [Marinomonas transparens]|uniref:Uncharacterized protein n=1 Tax=Marinomonas transparens TaxID=2795388 RepID=A0A934N5Q2_9GAMM|nr:hypothetical protein [Marinomonas transparens]MBJ7537281.1 hypothetical protein [Marinomonas transparens]